jgi:hypothetical protein
MRKDLLMRRTVPHVLKDRRSRRAEWNRYVQKDYRLSRELFGLSFVAAGREYRVEGWLPQNRVYPIYLVREDDGESFAATPIELSEAF